MAKSRGQEANDWALRELGNCVSLIRNGLSRKQNKDRQGLAVTRIETIALGKVDGEKVGFVQGLSDSEVARYRLRRGDILFSHINSEPQIGRTALYEGVPLLLLHGMNLLLIRAAPWIEPRFLHFMLSHLRETGVMQAIAGRAVGQSSINQGRLRSLQISVPDVDEQRKIGGLLLAVQRAIERQERLIALTAELKKALMHKLFTEGTRGEPLKQTEIGPVPEGWQVAPLAEFTESFQYGTSVKCGYAVAGLPVLRIPNVVGGHLDVTDLKFGTPKRNELETVRLRPRDLLFVRTNGVRENAGRCSMYRGELGEGCYFASYLIRARLREGLMPEFLEEYTRTETGVRLLAGRAARTADGKFNINTGTLQTLPVPKPKIVEQRLIVDVLASIDRKARNHAASQATLEALFRTLLHKLMTAEIRVGDLDLAGYGAHEPLPG
jgi:type I restriction enzyme, S subunit